MADFSGCTQALCFLQCCDTIGWVTGRASGLQKPVLILLAHCFLEQMGKENHGATS